MVAYTNPNVGYSQYKTQNAMTASPGELTLMLYEGCIKNLKLSKMYMMEKNVQRSHETSVKAQAIIAELERTLDMEYEISEQLFSLYVFINKQITASNIKKDPSLVDAPLELLTELRDTWQQAVRINRHQALGKGNII